MPSIQKIAILGGGVGAISTAWELTSVPGWNQRYEITIYQIGWRLGGKGASGRNNRLGDRIQEHGLHLWMGFYENAFQVMREAYEYCHRHDLMPGSPFASYKDAFTPLDNTSTAEYFDGGYHPWTATWPQTNTWPGESMAGDGPGTDNSLVWFYVIRLLELLAAKLEDFLTRVAHPLPLFPHWCEAALRKCAELLREAANAASALPGHPGEHQPGDTDGLSAILEVCVGLFQHLVTVLGVWFNDRAYLRRSIIMMDAGLAIIRGILADGLLTKGFSAIDHVEFSEWLRRHGCRNPKTPLTGCFYDACFAYVNGSGRVEDQNIAAGTMLNGLLRLILAYNKSIMFAMNAGMGDTVFAPLYLALRHRGVKFQFFHKVTSLGLSADKRSVDSIRMEVQATTRQEYDPLVKVCGVYCWPSEPLWEQLAEPDAIRETPVNHDLESWWCAAAPAGVKVLRRDEDFHIIVNGISLGALPYVCQELMAASPAWRDMIDRVKLVRTQAVQLWLRAPQGETFWTSRYPKSAVVTGFKEPFDTWADMSHLIEKECFPPAAQVKGIAYLCNALPDDGPAAPFSDPSYPDAQTDRVRANASAYLDHDIRTLWPEAVDSAGRFRRDLLVNAGGGDAFDCQFFRANVDPPELYVLSTAGSIAYRLAPGESGFDNLVLAGDWTRVELNLGCVEAAVQSGKMASNAICGEPAFISGPFGISYPIRDGSVQSSAADLVDTAQA